MTKAEALDKLIEAVEAGEAAPRHFNAVWSQFGPEWPIGHKAALADEGSLDAAKALHESLLPGWALQGMSMFPSGVWIASVYELKGDDWPKWTAYPSKDATARDPARAWLLATLKAYRAGL